MFAAGFFETLNAVTGSCCSDLWKNYASGCLRKPYMTRSSEVALGIPHPLGTTLIGSISPQSASQGPPFPAATEFMAASHLQTWQQGACS